MIRTALLTSLVMLAGVPDLLLAQANEPTPAPEGQSTDTVAPRSYVPADFARFAPRTALDMLRQVPGFTIRQEIQERGLGQATGNVVINGQRIAGKSNDVLTELGRVPAQNVERIDIVDGATLDVPGLSGAVANVIVTSTGISGQFAYRPEFRSHNTDPLFTRFDTSVSGEAGKVDYTTRAQECAGGLPSGPESSTFSTPEACGIEPSTPAGARIRSRSSKSATV